jgi:hypothetical protein
MERRRSIPQRPRAESLTSLCREALASGLRKVLSSEREASSFGPPGHARSTKLGQTPTVQGGSARRTRGWRVAPQGASCTRETRWAHS